MRMSTDKLCIRGHLAMLSITAICLGFATPQAWGDSDRKDIVATAAADGNFNTLLAAVKAAGLVHTLEGRGPFTVFAPTDAAFKRLPAKTVKSLLKSKNKDQLKAILTYHVVPGQVLARDAYGLTNAATVNGQRLNISRRDGKLVIGNAGVVVTDITCTNGVIHVIDRVLMPEKERIPRVAEQAGQFNTLLAAASAAGLAEVLNGAGPFTLFAPSDEAFNSLPEGTVQTLLKPENKQELVDILKYHVVSGRVYADQAAKASQASTLLGRFVETSVTADGLRINDALVKQADLETANGVIHVIDSVLLPKTMDPRQARMTLEDAIRRGVPIYNHGNHRECADIYAAACKAITESDSDQVPHEVMAVLHKTIDRSKHMHSSRLRAWTLRHGMDVALAGLRKMSLASSGIQNR